MNDIYPGLEYIMEPDTNYKLKQNHNLYIIRKWKNFNQNKIACCLSIPFPSSEIRLIIAVLSYFLLFLGYLRGFLTDWIVGRCLAFNYSGRS